MGMPNPIDSLRFVHTAILVEVERMRETIHSAASPEAVAHLAADLDFFIQLMEYHTRGEEIGLFPDLEKKAPHIADTYLVDHVSERETLAAMQAAIGGCAKGNKEALDELEKLVIAMATHAHGHIRKENELILPYVAESFSPEEQGQMLQKILSTIPQEKMALIVPWIVDRQPLDQAEAYVRILSHAMPPPVFAAAKGWIAEKCNPERAAELKSRIPELS